MTIYVSFLFLLKNWSCNTGMESFIIDKERSLIPVLWQSCISHVVLSQHKNNHK